MRWIILDVLLSFFFFLTSNLNVQFEVGVTLMVLAALFLLLAAFFLIKSIKILRVIFFCKIFGYHSRSTWSEHGLICEDCGHFKSKSKVLADMHVGCL
jgi:hypothetical protein